MNDIKIKKRVAKTFYEKRELPKPRQEYWPASTGELRELMTSRDASEPPLVLLGDGQHIRTSVLGERTFDVVRTEALNGLVSVDRESKLVRVEAGMRWGAFQEELAERGLSMERYKLYPASATIGGLLARRRPLHREMWDGDLRTTCVALSAATPATGDYGYIPAPRKASGPDLRYLFINGEGLMGAILDATFVAWTPNDGRLYRFQAEDTATAVRTYKAMHDLGIRISWAHYAKGELSIAIHANERVLKGIAREVAQNIAVPNETGNAADIAELRATLEASHNERRILATAKRTVAVYLSLNDVPRTLEHLEDIAESVEIWDWTRHRATAHVRFARGKMPSELPTAVSAVALAWHPFIDDEAVHWPHWMQTLKGEIDPDRRLAAGP